MKHAIIQPNSSYIPVYVEALPRASRFSSPNTLTPERNLLGIAPLPIRRGIFLNLLAHGVTRDGHWRADLNCLPPVPALLQHRALCARVAPLLHRYPTHEAHSGSRPFSVKERTPMPFRNLTMDYPLAGRVMSAVYPPSCGASIGGVPRFMGVRIA